MERRLDGGLSFDPLINQPSMPKKTSHRVASERPQSDGNAVWLIAGLMLAA